MWLFLSRPPAAIASISQTAYGVRVTFHDKLAALDRLARYLDLDARPEVGADGKPLIPLEWVRAAIEEAEGLDVPGVPLEK